MKKERSEAQRAADRRYREKHPNREKKIHFTFPAAEAEEIEKAIASTGLSKVDFLRWAARNINK